MRSLWQLCQFPLDFLLPNHFWAYLISFPPKRINGGNNKVLDPSKAINQYYFSTTVVLETFSQVFNDKYLPSHWHLLKNSGNIRCIWIQEVSKNRMAHLSDIAIHFLTCVEGTTLEWCKIHKNVKSWNFNPEKEQRKKPQPTTSWLNKVS